MKTFITIAIVGVMMATSALADDYSDNGAAAENQEAAQYQQQIDMDNMRQDMERQQQEIDEQREQMQQQSEVQYIPTGESGYVN